MLAWAGPEPAGPEPSGRPRRGAGRELVVERAVRAGHPIRSDGRLLTVARPRATSSGVLLLVDPEGTAGEQETVALEHAATVLPIELARLHSLAETELRLGRDLVADLVSGTGDGASRGPRRSATTCAGRTGWSSSARVAAGPRRPAARRPRRARPAPAALLMQRGRHRGAVAAVRPPRTARRQAGSPTCARTRRWAARCGIGVGGLCRGPTTSPAPTGRRSWPCGWPDGGGRRRRGACTTTSACTSCCPRSRTPPASTPSCRRWLGPLLDYDARRGGDLVETLARYLDCGGNYDATAAALALGRSTVRYRLRRIEELSGHDLGDPDTRFQLQLATRAWATRRALSGQYS